MRSVAELVALRAGLARAGVDVLVAADESVRKAEDPLRVAVAGAADVVVVKVAPLGGVGAGAGGGADAGHRARAAGRGVLGAGQLGRHRRRAGARRRPARRCPTPAVWPPSACSRPTSPPTRCCPRRARSPYAAGWPTRTGCAELAAPPERRAAGGASGWPVATRCSAGPGRAEAGAMTERRSIAVGRPGDPGRPPTTGCCCSTAATRGDPTGRPGGSPSAVAWTRASRAGRRAPRGAARRPGCGSASSGRWCCGAPSTFEFEGAGSSRRRRSSWSGWSVPAGGLDTSGWNDIERRALHELRWWTVAELAATDEVVYPEGLLDVLRDNGIGLISHAWLDWVGLSRRRARTAAAASCRTSTRRPGRAPGWPSSRAAPARCRPTRWPAGGRPGATSTCSRASSSVR